MEKDNNSARNIQIKKIFKFLEKISLSFKDEEFIMSLEFQFDAKGYLTDRQYQALLNVYERV